MQVRCKVCGKPLRDPVSTARGMGPKCAGIVSFGKTHHASQQQSSRSLYSSNSANHTTTNLFSFGKEPPKRVPETLRRFPPDLVDLVLTAPSTGLIAARLKLHSRQRRNNGKVHPATLLKQIRRLCIEHRVLFWPGLSMNLEPIPCIPCGENDWKLGANGRVMSSDELVAYLARYGLINPEHVRAQTRG